MWLCQIYARKDLNHEGVTQISCSYHSFGIPTGHCIVIKISNRPSDLLTPQFPQLHSIYIQINNRESSEFGDSQEMVYFQSPQPRITERKKYVYKYIFIKHLNFIMYWPDTCSITLHYLASLKQNKTFYWAVTIQTGYGICRVISNCKIWLTKSLLLTKKIGAYILVYKTFFISCAWPGNIL